jgi:hypothetical protein
MVLGRTALWLSRPTFAGDLLAAAGRALRGLPRHECGLAVELRRVPRRPRRSPSLTAAYFVTKAAKGGGDSEARGTSGDVINVVILLLLFYLVVPVFRSRKQAEPPKWMGRLQTATPGFSLKLGVLLLGVFPTDIITSVTVGAKLARDGDPWSTSLPFIGLTLLLLASPATLVLLLGRRAQVLLPKVRDWMNTNSWIVSSSW